MHPLSTFPDLLTFGLIAPLLLRLVVGLFTLYVGWERYKKPYKYTAILYAISGLLLILGLYTQITAIVSILLVSSDYFVDKGKTTFSKEKKILYFVVKIILLSLLLTGPGLFAFDIPL